MGITKPYFESERRSSSLSLMYEQGLMCVCVVLLEGIAERLKAICKLVSISGSLKSSTETKTMYIV